jgi:hypothetical protein
LRGAPDWQRIVTGPGGSSVGGYASLTGLGQTNTFGLLTQTGPFVVDSTTPDEGVTLTAEDGPVQINSQGSFANVGILSEAGMALQATGAVTIEALSGGATPDMEILSDAALRVIGATSLSLETVIVALQADATRVFVAPAGQSLSFYGSAAVPISTVAGMLSAVLDPNVKAVLTSLISALAGAAGVGLVLDGTT